MLTSLLVLADTTVFIGQSCIILILVYGFIRIFYLTNKKESNRLLHLLRKCFISEPFYPDSSMFRIEKEDYETIFDITIPEPYKRLERNSDKKSVWLSQQNAHFTNYMEQLNFIRSQLKSRLRKFHKCEAFEMPFQVNNNRYFYSKKYRKDQEHFILFTTGNVRHKGSILLDPNVEFYQQNVTIEGTWISDDSFFLSYAYILHSTDGRILNIKVRDVLTCRDNPSDVIAIPLRDDEDMSAFSLSWLHGCQGFFYTRKIKEINQAHSEKNSDCPEGYSESEEMTIEKHGVYFHRIGSKQKSDFIVFICDTERDQNGLVLYPACPIVNVSHDDSYLCIHLFEEHDSFCLSPYSERGNKVVIIDITNFNNVDCEGLGSPIPVVNNYFHR